MNQEHKNQLTKILNEGFGKTHINRMVEILEQKPGLFPLLVQILFENTEPVSRRAIWAIDDYSERHPEVILPYLEKIAEYLPLFQHDALKRHSLRILARYPLPVMQLGSLINICFDLLVSPTTPAAIKVHCMTILYHASEIEPEIKQELADSIAWRLEEESPGVINTGNKLLKKLSGEIP